MTADEMADIVRDMRIVPFTGITHRGEPADESIVRGGWTVVSFGFTYCTLACPTLHREIYRAADRLADRGVRFVTISVDPAHDTVEQMASHVAQWGVRGDCWTFVRVEADALPGILAELKMPALSDDTANMITLPGGERMANIQHPTRFFVTGPDGTVRGLWRGTDPSEVDAMIRWLLERPR
jgi:cytochrome oxidase Cu insertion factor (SCO1/SenC/PrrC family)